VDELSTALRLLAMIHCDNCILRESRIVLCMLLARLEYPNRLSDLAMKFGWPVERISRISTTVQAFIYSKWKYLLEWDTIRLTLEKLLQYAEAVERKGAPIRTV